MLFRSGWSGLFIESNEKDCGEISVRFRPVIESGRLYLVNAFVNRENINKLIGDIYTGDIDLLSIDIDGNDYHIWKAINVINPRVVIIEYNGKFSPDVEWIMAYYEHHIWRGSDWHGASLKSMELLGREKGYQLVGTNLSGSNAFFVRNDLSEGKFYEPATAEKLFNPLNVSMTHVVWHTSKYCLVDQKEGLGIFNYIEKDILPFSERKLQDNSMEYCFTCRNAPRKIKQIEIEIKNGKKIYIKAYSNGKELKTVYGKEKNSILIDMAGLELRQAVLKVDVILYGEVDQNSKLLYGEAKIIY